MFTIGAPFFSSPASGDHPPGDGFTMLQTDYSTGSLSDMSSYSVPYTQSGGSLTGGYFEIRIPVGSPANKYLQYYANNIARQAAGQELTIELFMSLEYRPKANNVSLQNHVYLDNFTSTMTSGPNGQISVYTKGGGLETQFIQFSNYYDSPVGPVITPTLLGQMTHLAWVWGTDNKVNQYYNGTAWVGPINDTSYLLTPSSPFPSLTLGTSGVPNYWTDFTMRYYGTRIRRAKMYSGASFTPPTSPADWGLP